MTQTFKTGPNYTVKEIRNYILVNNISLVKAIKDKIELLKRIRDNIALDNGTKKLALELNTRINELQGKTITSFRIWY